MARGRLAPTGPAQEWAHMPQSCSFAVPRETAETTWRWMAAAFAPEGVLGGTGRWPGWGTL